MMGETIAKTVPTVSIYGIAVSRMNMRETVEYLTAVIEARTPHQVITANPIMVMAALERPDYMAVMRRAELVVPDGAGLVWAAGYLGVPVAERVAGFDLMHKLLERGREKGWKVFLLGAAHDVVRASAERLEQMYPGIRIVGWRDGFFKSEQDGEVVDEIVAAAPDLLFVANSLDRQEPWIDRYKSRLNVPVMMGVGGSFDIVAGRLKRAPLFFQRMRLEWFYRLLQEPKRFKRMLALPKFVMRVIRDKKKALHDDGPSAK
jgi:N-acetylglucosaminyldiphosphoundecaprenol N-acetyl-beta-D-mannosaminyltransferase